MKHIFSLKHIIRHLIILVHIICVIVNCVVAQSKEGSSISNKKKESIDNATFNNWPSLVQPVISMNGEYFGYVVHTASPLADKLTVQDSSGKLMFDQLLKGWYKFSGDSKLIIYINSNDSLCIRNLADSSMKCIADVSMFDLIGDYVIFQKNNNLSDIFIINPNENVVRVYHSVKSWYKLNRNKLLLITQEGGTNLLTLSILAIKTNRIKDILKVSSIGNILIDKKGTQILITEHSIDTTLLYYNISSQIRSSLALPPNIHIDISRLGYFSLDGSLLFLNVFEDDIQREEKISNVNIWNYMDGELQSQQMRKRGSNTYRAIVRVFDGRFIKLGNHEDWIFFPKFQDSIALIRHQDHVASGGELNWNVKGQYQWSVIFTKNGKKEELTSCLGKQFVEVSPSGKYIIFYDEVKLQYYTYELGTGKICCIACGIDEQWDKSIYTGHYGRRIAGWQTNDDALLIYGEYDIWRVDPSGRTGPINLTNGYGRKNKIKFFLSLEEYSSRQFFNHESLLLSAFDLDSKENGFYRKLANVSGDPELLTMGPYIYDITDNPHIPQTASFSPIRALKSNLYVVRRMSASESPNYFLTRDFVSFKQLSHIYPEREYNWYKSELHRWVSLDNKHLQGVLYKPENFDSTKTYPVIFYYYETKSDALNAFLTPNVLDAGCGISIPHFTSNGYIVFCPDIHYIIGDPMQGTYDAIISSANYIMTLPYVNRQRMGLQGCSWGAIQTNYIISQTSYFAAACSASGLGNWVSSYGSLLSSGESAQGFYEIGQLRMGKTLWETPDIYIKNSPVFHVNGVDTPILLMHTINDDLCPLSNILEYFTSLRRMGKKAWILLYEGNHVVSGQDAEDFSTRMDQFFDHYLKDGPLPKWMTEDVIRGN